jgi:hypothetical protein
MVLLQPLIEILKLESCFGLDIRISLFLRNSLILNSNIIHRNDEIIYILLSMSVLAKFCQAQKSTIIGFSA